MRKKIVHNNIRLILITEEFSQHQKKKKKVLYFIFDKQNTCNVSPFFSIIEFWSWSFRRLKASPSVGSYTPFSAHSVPCLLYRSRFPSLKQSVLQQGSVRARIISHLQASLTHLVLLVSQTLELQFSSSPFLRC